MRFAVRAWYRNGTLAAPHAAAVSIARPEITRFVFRRCYEALLCLDLLCISETSAVCWAIAVCLDSVLSGTWAAQAVRGVQTAVGGSDFLLWRRRAAAVFAAGCCWLRMVLLWLE